MRRALKAVVCLGLSLSLGFSTVAFGAEKKEGISSEVVNKRGQLSSEVQKVKDIQGFNTAQSTKVSKKSKRDRKSVV